MRNTWVALAAALLGLGAARGQVNEPQVLPVLPPARGQPAVPQVLPVLPPAQAAPSAGAHPVPAPVVVSEGDATRYYGLLGGCHCRDCLRKFCAWISYCPPHTTLHHLHVPYNPQPPVHLYFLYPPVVDGPGHTPACCSWRRYCPKGHCKGALSCGQNSCVGP